MSEKGRKKKNIIKECFILEKYDISIFFFIGSTELFSKFAKQVANFYFLFFFSNSIIWDGGGYETSRKTC